MLLENDMKEYDNLKIDRQKFKAFIPTEEKIFLIDKIDKRNDFKIKQERIIILTNKALYNIKSNLFDLILSLQRRFAYKDMKGITYSNTFNANNEFIIHGNDNEYDYNYICKQKNDVYRIICYIATFYLNETLNPLKICKIENKDDFYSSLTTKNDISQNPKFSRMNEKYLINTIDFLTKYTKIIKKKRTKKDEEEDNKKIRELFKLVDKDYTIYDKICVVCLREKNNQEPKIDIEEQKNQESKVDFYIEKLIEDIDEYNFNSIFEYTEPDVCPHFYHETCINIVKAKNKNKQFKCYLCKDHTCTKNLYLFGNLYNYLCQDFISIHNYYRGEKDKSTIGYYYLKTINEEFIIKYLPLVFSDETARKLKKINELTKNLVDEIKYKKLPFNIPLNQIDMFESIYNTKVKEKKEEEERKRKEREEERERQRHREYDSDDNNSDNDSDDDYRYRRRDNSGDRRRDYSDERKRKEDAKKKVRLKVCQECKKYCMNCHGNLQQLLHSYGHGNSIPFVAHNKCVPNKNSCFKCFKKNSNMDAINICWKCKHTKSFQFFLSERCYYCKERC